LSGFKMLARVC